jgi:ArsR family transcriptional regulator
MQITDNQTHLSLIEQGFHALSDSLRLQIIDLLQSREMCVCEICEKMAISQSKLSFHLKKLKDAHLVDARQQGRWIYYRLNVTQISALEAYLAQYKHLTLNKSFHLCED